MKASLIIGITGQDGYYLSELLVKKNYDVYGVIRKTSELYCSSRIGCLEQQLNLRYGDITDKFSILNVINEILNCEKNYETIEIYNLAAQSHVGISFKIPNYTAEVDAIGVLNILEIVKNLKKEDRDKIKFYQACTSELYGRVLETPQNEDTPFNPLSPYAVAKQFGYKMLCVYRESYDIFAVNGILFNHESPKRGPNFVTMKVVNGIKDIINNKKQYIELGNLYSKRDWGHAKDYVMGMWLMMQQERPKDYVLATGETYSIKEFVERAFLYKNITIRWENEGVNEIGIDNNGITRIKVSEKYYRPNEVDLLLGDATRAEKELGWKREFKSLDDLIHDMFN